MDKIFEINSVVILALTETLLLGGNSFNQYDNWRFLDAIIPFTVTSKRFDDPLLVCPVANKQLKKTSLYFSIVFLLE